MSHIVTTQCLPFGQAQVQHVLPAGLSLLEMSVAVCPINRHDVRAEIYVADIMVPASRWHVVRPKAGVPVIIRIVPQGGGGGKNPLRTLLTVAITLAAPMFGGALAGAIGIPSAGIMGVSAASIGSGIISVAGNLLISAIAPAPKQKINSLSPNNQRDSQTLFIEGARNQKRPHQPVPRVLGFHRQVPPLAADSWTETAGGKQYVRQLFLWGYGELEISDLKIGDTALSNYDDVEVQTVVGALPVAPSLSLYPNDITQTDLSIQLKQPDGWAVQTTDLNADEIIVDITLPNGLYNYDDQGKKRSFTVSVQAEYAPTGTSAWVALDAQTWTQATTAAIRKEMRVKVTRGQYDVRVRKTSADANEDGTSDNTYWTGLKTVTYGNPISHTGVAATALRMRATEQLNGPVDDLSGLCKTVCLDWDSTSQTWVKRATNNPASLYRLVLQDRANARPVPDNKLNLPEIQAWHEFCATKGLRFNAVYDYTASLQEVLNDICAVGRAVPDKVNGKWTVAVDREQTIPAQLFTPRNTWDYEGDRAFPEMPHALRCEFLNEEKGYARDERIVYADGYSAANASDYQALEFYGVTSPAQIWRMAREYLATMVHRSITHSFNVDLENLVVRKGQLFHFAHDVVMAGVGSARILGIEFDGAGENIVAFTCDEEFEMVTGQLYGVRIRRADGTDIQRAVITTPGLHTRLAFESPQPLESVGVDNLFAFGLRTRETIPLVLQRIERREGYTARLYAKDAAPQIYQASTGPVPPFQSSITAPVSNTRPLPPVLRGIQMGQAVMVQTADGRFIPRLQIDLDNPNSFGVVPRVFIRRSDEDEQQRAQLVMATPERVILEGLEDQQTYFIQITYEATGGSAIRKTLVSDPLLIAGMLYETSPGPPADPTGLRVSVNGRVLILSWDACPDVDYVGTEVRFTNETFGPSYTAGTLIRTGITSNFISLPFRYGTYMIKHRDKSGRLSVNMASVVPSAQDLALANVVEVVTEHPTFAGAKDNVQVVSGAMTLINTALPGIYSYVAPLDLGEVYTCTLLPTLTAQPQNRGAYMAAWSNLAGVESLSGAVPSGSWRAEHQVSITNDDPLGLLPNWSDWRPLEMGEYTFRGVRFRIVLTSLNPVVSPLVSAAEIIVDMPDRQIGLDGVVVPDTGLTVTYDAPFAANPVVLVMPLDGQSGDRLEFVSRTSAGFTLQIYNAAGVAVSRTVNWLVKGYGRKI